MAERKNKDLQNVTYEIKDRIIRIPLKSRGELRCSGGVSSSCSTINRYNVS